MTMKATICVLLLLLMMMIRPITAKNSTIFWRMEQTSKPCPVEDGYVICLSDNPNADQICVIRRCISTSGTPQTNTKCNLQEITEEFELFCPHITCNDEEMEIRNLCYPRHAVENRFFLCYDEEFRCTRTKRCIPRSWMNDGTIDCSTDTVEDGSDEEGNGTDCNYDIEFFSPVTGKCQLRRFYTPWNKKIPTQPTNPTHETDEISCSEKEFSCLQKNIVDERRCLPLHYRCDGSVNCKNGVDEIEECSSAPTQYRSNNNVLPWETYLLSDKEDIEGIGFKCMYRISSGKLLWKSIPQFFLINNHVVCEDKEDNCLNDDGDFNCSRCISDGTIIHPSQLCDGISNCADDSDESPCSYKLELQPDKKLDCNNTSCSSKCLSGKFNEDGRSLNDTIWTYLTNCNKNQNLTLITSTHQKVDIMFEGTNFLVRFYHSKFGKLDQFCIDQNCSKLEPSWSLYTELDTFLCITNWRDGDEPCKKQPTIVDDNPTQIMNRHVITAIAMIIFLVNFWMIFIHLPSCCKPRNRNFQKIMMNIFLVISSLFYASGLLIISTIEHKFNKWRLTTVCRISGSFLSVSTQWTLHLTLVIVATTCYSGSKSHQISNKMFTSVNILVVAISVLFTLIPWMIEHHITIEPSLFFQDIVVERRSLQQYLEKTMDLLSNIGLEFSDTKELYQWLTIGEGKSWFPQRGVVQTADSGYFDRSGICFPQFAHSSPWASIYILIRDSINIAEVVCLLIVYGKTRYGMEVSAKRRLAEMESLDNAAPQEIVIQQHALQADQLEKEKKQVKSVTQAITMIVITLLGWLTVFIATIYAKSGKELPAAMYAVTSCGIFPMLACLHPLLQYRSRPLERWQQCCHQLQHPDSNSSSTPQQIRMRRRRRAPHVREEQNQFNRIFKERSM